MSMFEYSQVGRLAGVPAPVGRQALRPALRVHPPVRRERAPEPRRHRRGRLPEVVELIQKEGLIERDEEGKWQVTPKGIRRIQDKSLDDLFQTFRRDSVGRHDTQQKGEGTVQLEDTRPYVYGDSLANLNMHETLKNAYVRQGGGVPDQAQPRRLRRARDRVPDPLRHGRPDRHERLDGPLRQVLHDQEGRDRAPGDGPGPVPARLDRDDRVLHLRQPDDRAAAPQLGAQAGEHVRQPDPPAVRPGQAARAACPSTSPTSTPACGWPAATCSGSRRPTSRSS